MILLPIGHEEAECRRLPSMTFGLMILCVLAFILSGRGSMFPEDDVQLEERFGEAYEYYLLHPNLEASHEFLQILEDNGAADAPEEMVEALRSLQPPGGDSDLAAEQAEFDGLVDRALAAYKAHPFQRFGLVPARTSPFTLISHMFMHAGWLHLLGNLLILYLAGPFIEDVWGRPIYLGFYVLGGIAAALTFVGFNPDSSIPMVGASGAIAAVMGAFLVRYNKTKIHFFYMFGFFLRGTFAAPALLMLPLWFVEQVFMVMMTDGAGGGVAYWAHIGGFVFGAGTAGLFRVKNVEERFLAAKLEDKIHKTLVHNPAVDRALEAQAGGDQERAFDLLRRELRQDSSNPDAVLAFWAVALEVGRGEEAAPHLLRLIHADLRRGAPDEAAQHYRELNEHLPNFEIEPGLLALLAEGLDRIGQSEPARVALRRSLLGLGRSRNAALALKIARAARKLDPVLARGALKLALSWPELEPELREDVTAFLQAMDRSVVPLAPPG